MRQIGGNTPALGLRRAKRQLTACARNGDRAEGVARSRVLHGAAVVRRDQPLWKFGSISSRIPRA
jgi:hypothetical protein